MGVRVESIRDVGVKSCADRLAVLVVAHIKGLDLPWIVIDKGGRLELALAQPPLMLRLREGVRGRI